MERLKKGADYRNCEFVKGIRVRNISLKVFLTQDKKYVVVKRKYFFGFPVQKGVYEVDDYELVEDEIRDLKFDSHFRKIKFS